MSQTDLGKVMPTPIGEYSATTNYKQLDIVSYNGASYIAKSDVNASDNNNSVTVEDENLWLKLSDTSNVLNGKTILILGDSVAADLSYARRPYDYDYYTDSTPTGNNMINKINARPAQDYYCRHVTERINVPFSLVGATLLLRKQGQYFYSYAQGTTTISSNRSQSKENAIFNTQYPRDPETNEETGEVIDLKTNYGWYRCLEEQFIDYCQNGEGSGNGQIAPAPDYIIIQAGGNDLETFIDPGYCYDKGTYNSGTHRYKGKASYYYNYYGSDFSGSTTNEFFGNIKLTNITAVTQNTPAHISSENQLPTFQALRHCIKTIRKTYPKTQIIGITRNYFYTDAESKEQATRTPWRFLYSNYVLGMIGLIYNDMNVPCLALNGISNIFNNEGTNGILYSKYYAPDGRHFSHLGYRRIEQMIIGFIQSGMSSGHTPSWPKVIISHQNTLEAAVSDLIQMHGGWRITSTDNNQYRVGLMPHSSYDLFYNPNNSYSSDDTDKPTNSMENNDLIHASVSLIGTEAALVSSKGEIFYYDKYKSPVLAIGEKSFDGSNVWKHNLYTTKEQLSSNGGFIDDMKKIPNGIINIGSGVWKDTTTDVTKYPIGMPSNLADIINGYPTFLLGGWQSNGYYKGTLHILGPVRKNYSTDNNTVTVSLNRPTHPNPNGDGNLTFSTINIFYQPSYTANGKSYSCWEYTSEHGYIWFDMIPEDGNNTGAPTIIIQNVTTTSNNSNTDENENS